MVQILDHHSILTKNWLTDAKRIYEAVEVSLVCCMREVFLTGIDSGVGMASPVGCDISGGMRDLLLSGFCLAIW